MVKITKMYQEGNVIYGDCLMADGVVHEKKLSMPFTPGENNTFTWVGSMEFLGDFLAMLNGSFKIIR